MSPSTFPGRTRHRGPLFVRLAVIFALVVPLGWVRAVPAAAEPRATPPPVARPSTGYRLAAADGGVFTYGDAEFRGSAGDLPLRAPIVGTASPPSGAGYWLVARDGGIFAFGVPFVGSTGGQHLNQPVVAMASTPTGAGYWLVARDGGIFSFGDARFFGSTGAITLNQPIVGIAATPTGAGYWLVARDGGIFSFGDARFFGSTGAITLNQPIVGMAASPTGAGYWLVARDGGIFSFGDAAFHGSTGAIRLNQPIVGMAATGFGSGYWLVASDGGIFAFGDAGFLGSAGGSPLNSPVVGMTVRPKPGRPGTAAFYYPWYGGSADVPAWFHWANNGREPPQDLAANFFPVRGAYRSADRAIVDQQMTELAAAGVETVVISWWGLGSFEDQRLGTAVAAARAHGLRPAIHVEPYPGRTPDSVQRDLLTLSDRYRIEEYWIYVSDGPPADEWRRLTDRLAGFTIWAHGHLAGNGVRGLFAAYAARAGFDGVYTYDPLGYSPAELGVFCARARARGLACSPSVSPGYDGRRGVPDNNVRDRRNGDRFDEYWAGAYASGADVISITSYNEWHEGTQIEPAAAGVCTGTSPSIYCYSSYDGAYGRTGRDAEGAYLARTRFWTDGLKR